MKAKHDALVEALTGMFDDHHGELAQMLLDQIRFTTSIRAPDALITRNPGKPLRGPHRGDPGRPGRGRARLSFDSPGRREAYRRAGAPTPKRSPAGTGTCPPGAAPGALIQAHQAQSVTG
jgi:hypothetical protein